ncbi:MAG TPA: PAS domain S-box protein [Bacteroidales bacterium]|nr:PAS domain S-box protein [Bacteroidales bacterium]
MKADIRQLIDFNKFDTLLEGFNKSTGLISGIFDLEGNILSQSGWRQICVEFHRSHSETSQKCNISDTLLSAVRTEECKYNFYKCLNGLVDVAVPIMIDGVHAANLFSGQFFLEEPDFDFFRKQAKDFGFDEKAYLEALSKVPVVSKEEVITAMDFLLDITQLLCDLAIQKAHQVELNKKLKVSEQNFKSVFDSAGIGHAITFPSGEVYVNDTFSKIMGYSREELQAKKWQEMTPVNEIPVIEAIMEPLLKGEKTTERFQKKFIRKDGSLMWADVCLSVARDEQGSPLHYITSVIDITESKESQEEIRLAQDRFEKVAATTPGIVYSFKMQPDGKFLFHYGVDRLKKYLGIPNLRIEEDAKAIMNLSHPDDLYHLTESIAISARELTPWHFEWRLNHPLRGERWIECQSMPMREPDGSILWTGVAIDITKRKNYQKAISESEERYRSLFENMNAGFVHFEVIQNVNGVPIDLLIVAANEDFEKITEVKLTDSIGKSLTTILPGIEKEEPAWIEIYSKVALSGEPIQFEHTSEFFDKFFTVSAFKAGPKQCAVTFVDITARKKAEMELIASKERYRNLLEVAPVGITVVKEGIITFVNPAGLNIIGAHKSDQIIGKEIKDFIYPAYLQESSNRIQRLLQGEKGLYPAEIKYVRLDGKVIDVEIFATKIIFNNTPAIQVIVTDITERKQLINELNKLNSELEFKVKQRTSQLEATNKELESFSYSVSHDLRAPLRHISGYLDLINKKFKDALPEKAQHYLDNVADASKQMGKLIDDLLLFSRTGRQEIRHAELDMGTIVNEIVENKIWPGIEGREINWTINPLPVVQGDYSLLKQVWINLLDNAVKYTRKQNVAEITLGSWEEPKDFVFFVRDNGVGFDMKYANKLFGVFERLHDLTEFEGNGIGLASVKNIVTKHFGKVWAESEPEKGATIYFSLPKTPEEVL